MKVICFGLALLLITQLAGCATDEYAGQLLPEKSRATPELALLNEQARLADVGGEAAEAESLYKAVLRRMPNDADTWFRLGNLYANNNRAAEAAIAYERTLVADNGHIRAWHNLGVIRLRQSYASFLQAQALSDEDNALTERIDNTLDQLSKLSILESEPKPKAVRPAISSGTVHQPAENNGIVDEQFEAH